MMRAWGSRERCKSMPMWKDSKGGHAIRAPRGKVIATAYRPRRQALHKEPRTPIYKRETMHIRLATTWHMCAPDCHGALFLRTRRPSWTPSEGYAQSGRINIGIAAGNREEYAIPQSSRNALRGRPFRPSATDWGVAAPGPALRWTCFDGCGMRFDELETLRPPAVPAHSCGRFLQHRRPVIHYLRSGGWRSG